MATPSSDLGQSSSPDAVARELTDGGEDFAIAVNDRMFLDDVT